MSVSNAGFGGLSRSPHSLSLDVDALPDLSAEERALATIISDEVERVRSLPPPPGMEAPPPQGRGLLDFMAPPEATSPEPAGDSRPWFEILVDYTVVIQCATKAARPVSEIAGFVWRRCAPDNATAFFWMAQYFGLEESMPAPMSTAAKARLIEQIRSEGAKAVRDEISMAGAKARAAKYADAKKRVIADWAWAGKRGYTSKVECGKFWEGEFAKENLKVGWRTISEDWLNGIEGGTGAATGSDPGC